MIILFFKQKTAYEMRISDWSSDVCSSDLVTFTTGSDSYSPSFQSALDSVAANLVRYPNSIVDVYGHTDTVGTASSNRSEERRVGKEWVRTCRLRWSPYH